MNLRGSKGCGGRATLPHPGWLPAGIPDFPLHGGVGFHGLTPCGAYAPSSWITYYRLFLTPELEEYPSSYPQAAVKLFPQHTQDDPR